MVVQVREPADSVMLSPADRYALVGKTGCGKTTFTSVLCETIVPQQFIDDDWQVWWVDSKGDPKDLARLARLGYIEGNVSTGLPKQKRVRREKVGRLYFRVRDYGGATVVDQAQHICRLAFRRRRVLLVIDEYTQVVPGKRTAGRALDDVFTRGRGLGIGLIGSTQEPVDIPRKLLSQASHLMAFDLSFPNDIKYMQGLIADYHRPTTQAERHAFYHLWLDGDSIPRYYSSLRAWRSRVVEGTAEQWPQDTSSRTSVTSS